MNQENYRDVVRQFNVVLRRRRLPIRAQWFQQDGATPHTAIATRALLTEKFGDNIISLKTTHAWSHRSPDLNAPDFFLWGYTKDNVYKNNPTTILDLKHEIEVFMKGINVDTCQRVVETCQQVIQNFAVRVRECLVRRGGHIEHILHAANRNI